MRPVPAPPIVLFREPVGGVGGNGAGGELRTGPGLPWTEHPSPSPTVPRAAVLPLAHPLPQADRGNVHAAHGTDVPLGAIGRIRP